MATKLIGFTIDNGGSSLRVLPLDRSETVPVTDSIIEFDNEFYKIPVDVFRPKNVDDKRAFISIIDAPNANYKGMYAVGITGRMYSGKLLPLNPHDRKSESENFYLQLIFDVAHGIIRRREFALIDSEYGTEVCDDELKLDYLAIIGTNIPIGEHTSDKDMVGTLKQAVCGHYKVSFPLIDGTPTISFEIRAEYFGVLPEGGVVVSSLGSRIRPDMYSMVIDIGHISSDISIYYGKHLDGKSYLSSTAAGTTLMSLVQRQLEDDGYRVNAAMVQMALETGCIKNGTDLIDVADPVRRAQRDFISNYLHADFINLMQRANVIAEQIDVLVPVGMPMNQVDGLEYLPEVVKEDLGMRNVQVLTNCEDARYANLLAIEKFTNALMAKARTSIGSVE